MSEMLCAQCHAKMITTSAGTFCGYCGWGVGMPVAAIVDARGSETAQHYIQQCIALEAQLTEKNKQIERVKKALYELERFKPQDTPEFFAQNAGYEQGDENEAFFTEAFLYTLLGKHNARTLLSLVRQLRKALKGEGDE